MKSFLSVLSPAVPASFQFQTARVSNSARPTPPLVECGIFCVKRSVSQYYNI